MKSSGLADSPFFDKQTKQTATPLHTKAIPVNEKAVLRDPDDMAKQEVTPMDEREDGNADGHDIGILAVRQDGLTANRHDGKPAVYSDERVEKMRYAVKQVGKERSEHRLTAKEKADVGDIVYRFKRKGTKTTENEIARIAINFLLDDYRQRGHNSMLVRVLQALNS